MSARKRPPRFLPEAPDCTGCAAVSFRETHAVAELEPNKILYGVIKDVLSSVRIHTFHDPTIPAPAIAALTGFAGGIDNGATDTSGTIRAFSKLVDNLAVTCVTSVHTCRLHCAGIFEQFPEEVFCIEGNNLAKRFSEARAETCAFGLSDEVQAKAESVIREAKLLLY